MWSVCPALLSPHAEDVELPSGGPSPGAGLGESLAQALHHQPRATLVLLDLDPVLGVQTAAMLYRHGLAHPVLVLPRWPYDRAVLPVEALVDHLLRCAPEPGPPRRLPHVAFVLDGARGTRIPYRSRRDPRADNRTQLGVHDLPDLRTLQARGIQRILVLRFAPA